MNESIKATLGLIIAACALTGIMAWLPGATNEVSTLRWWLRVGCPVLGIVCLAPLIWAQTRRNKVPDFLAQVSPRYFERDGFCFATIPQIVNGDSFMQIYYQNRYERPCEAQILIRASSGLSDISLGVSCNSAEFGCSTIPWHIPQYLLGERVSLSLYAGVNYPNGRGTLLRYKDGLRVGAVGMDFWREGLQIAGAVGGALVLSRPARIQLTLPSGASANTRETISVETRTIWKLGDPIL